MSDKSKFPVAMKCRADRNGRYMSSFTFANGAGYDSIEYDFASGFLGIGAGRWDGIVVSGKPRP
jgi:hypothetical protein